MLKCEAQLEVVTQPGAGTSRGFGGVDTCCANTPENSPHIRRDDTDGYMRMRKSRDAQSTEFRAFWNPLQYEGAAIPMA
jgi:hypothetical protein